MIMTMKLLETTMDFWLLTLGTRRSTMDSVTVVRCKVKFLDLYCRPINVGVWDKIFKQMYVLLFRINAESVQMSNKSYF
jgi:hypothetical protein